MADEFMKDVREEEAMLRLHARLKLHAAETDKGRWSWTDWRGIPVLQSVCLWFYGPLWVNLEFLASQDDQRERAPSNVLSSGTRQLCMGVGLFQTVRLRCRLRHFIPRLHDDPSSAESQ